MKIKKKLNGYRRVLHIARKPDKEEYRTSSKISAIGIMLIGTIGFFIFLLFTILGFAGI